jgi:hypothetical protein
MLYRKKISISNVFYFNDERTKKTEKHSYVRIDFQTGNISKDRVEMTKIQYRTQNYSLEKTNNKHAKNKTSNKRQNNRNKRINMYEESE